MTEQAGMQLKTGGGLSPAGGADLAIYVSQACATCVYAYEVADRIRQRYPQVRVQVIDIATTAEEAPAEVFATPTYLLNGRVWSLGNPSEQKVQEAFGPLRERG